MKDFKQIISALLFWVSGGRIRTATAKVEIEKRAKSWKAKSDRMQWELNREHLNRFGWYVNDAHEVVNCG